MEICQICFGSYLKENTKDHLCPEFYNCGACGEICDAESGTITNSNGEGNFGEFTHKAELCAAQDEICEICKATVSQCDCNRCEDCGTIYAAADVLENLNDDNNCATCAKDMASVEAVLNATQEIAPKGWTVTAEYPDSVGVTHPTLTDDQFIMLGDVNGYFAFNDAFNSGANGAMENLTNAAEIAANFWQQIAAIYPDLVKGE
jgi:hypothetical protein